MASLKRKGADLVLAESSGLLESAKRYCATRAANSIKELNHKQASKGVHAPRSVEGCSLYQAIKIQATAFGEGAADLA